MVNCNKRFIVLKLLLEPSLKHTMHTAITAKSILLLLLLSEDLECLVTPVL